MSDRNRLLQYILVPMLWLAVADHDPAHYLMLVPILPFNRRKLYDRSDRLFALSKVSMIQFCHPQSQKSTLQNHSVMKSIMVIKDYRVIQTFELKESLEILVYYLI